MEIDPGSAVMLAILIGLLCFRFPPHRS